MAKKVRFLLAIFVFLFVITSCGSSSKTSVDPWPGLFRLKETNKKGYKTQKKRNKRLKKAKKKRLNTSYFYWVKEFEQENFA